MTLFLDADLWRLMLTMAAPLVLAALGELLMERSGVLNVGIEGMTAVAAAVAFLGLLRTGSALAGAGLAMAAGLLLALGLAWYAVGRGSPSSPPSGWSRCWRGCCGTRRWGSACARPARTRARSTQSA